MPLMKKREELKTQHVHSTKSINIGVNVNSMENLCLLLFARNQVTASDIEPYCKSVATPSPSLSLSLALFPYFP